MKGMGNGEIAPCILDLAIRWW